MVPVGGWLVRYGGFVSFSNQVDYLHGFCEIWARSWDNIHRNEIKLTIVRSGVIREIVWTIMRPLWVRVHSHEIVWTIMRSCEPSWDRVDHHEIRWTIMRSFGSSGDCADHHEMCGPSWGRVDHHEMSRTIMRSRGPSWDRVNHHEIVWTIIRSCGPSWDRVNHHEFDGPFRQGRKSVLSDELAVGQVNYYKSYKYLTNVSSPIQLATPVW